MTESLIYINQILTCSYEIDSTKLEGYDNQISHTHTLHSPRKIRYHFAKYTDINNISFFLTYLILIYLQHTYVGLE